MEKVLLAVGFRQLEEFLEKQLKKEFVFVGTTTYREGIIRAIGQKNPNIVVIRETLEGKENILSIIYEIRTKFPKIRIVFIAGKRKQGDALLATLVNYGVYDILQGEKIRAHEVVALIRKPNEYKDVQHLQPVPVLDENKNQVLFQAPDAIIKEKEVVKEIYIDGNKNQDGGYVKPPELAKESHSEGNFEIPLTKEPVEKTNKVEPTKTQVKETEKKSFLEKLMDKKDMSHSLSQNMVSTTKQKIITFMGSKNGVGNSSMALNTALTLAQRGLKTIFIEFDDRTPVVSYWYELGYVEDGIDSSLKALSENDYEKIEEAIIRTTNLKKTESLMQKNYKKFPDTLDFMFFSNKYLTREHDDGLENELNIAYSKELFLYLMFQFEYDFIVLDVPSDIDHPATINALIYSNKVFMTLTQDVASIGYSIYKMNELSKRGIHVDKKLYYIVNKFERANLTLKETEEWIQTKNITTVPILNKEFINANFLGLPATLYSKNAGLKSAFQKIEKLIV